MFSYCIFFFLTTEYTEAGEPILKITEKISVISVWERSDLSVYSVVKRGLGISRVEYKDFFGVKVPRKSLHIL